MFYASECAIVKIEFIGKRDILSHFIQFILVLYQSFL